MPTPQVYRLTLSPSGMRVMLAALMVYEQRLDTEGSIVDVALVRGMIRDVGRLLEATVSRQTVQP